MAALEIVWRNRAQGPKRQLRVKKGVVRGIYVVEVFFPEKDRWASLFALTLNNRAGTKQRGDPMDTPLTALCAWQG
ncbi:MAG TPA: hypothetical protein VF753_14090 [Terriglobales bacterium]